MCPTPGPSVTLRPANWSVSSKNKLIKKWMEAGLFGVKKEWEFFMNEFTKTRVTSVAAIRTVPSLPPLVFLDQCQSI